MEPAKGRALRVPFGGPAAEFARTCLTRQFPDIRNADPYEASRYLHKRWKAQAEAIKPLLVATYSASRLAMMPKCASSVVFDVKQTGLGCQFFWSCPFCYGRSLIDLWHLLARHSHWFTIDAVIAQTDTTERAWYDLLDARRVKQRQHAGTIAWQFVTPTAPLSVHAVTLLPAEREAPELFEDLSVALAYRPEWLEAPPARVAYALQLMQGCRTRNTSGIYRGTSHVDSPDPQADRSA